MYRGGVVAVATARLIFACRIRRSAVRRTVPLTYGESRLAQNVALFAAQGVAATTVRQIADEAGVLSGSLLL